MGSYQYTLERYKGSKSRYACPNCGKPRVFSRYIDTETGKYLPDQYGRCNRENNCNYHLNPYQDGYGKRKAPEGSYKQVNPYSPPKPIMSSETIYIPSEIMRKSLRAYGQNNFVQFLIGLVGEEMTKRLIERFHIGTSTLWEGATVFWLIDQQGRVAAGQVALFDEKGSTVKKLRPDGSKKRFTSWVHYALKISYQKRGKPTPQWLEDYIEHSPKFPCLYGLPQLKHEPLTKPIAIVEAPKTAIIATAYLPQFIWLAVGAKAWLNADRLAAIKGRKVVLFPDNGAFKLWSQKAKEFSDLAKFEVSNLFEQKAAREGSDLADYLVNHNLREYQVLEETEPPTPERTAKVQANPKPVLALNPQSQTLNRMISQNPTLGKLMHTFSLTIN